MKTQGQGDLLGSLVLVHYQDRPAVYARIDAVEPDVKKDWHQVTLLLLTIPAKSITWILREEYVRGAPFTMGGQSMRLEPVVSAKPRQLPGRDGVPEKEDGSGKTGKVVPFKKGRT